MKKLQHFKHVWSGIDKPFGRNEASLSAYKQGYSIKHALGKCFRLSAHFILAWKCFKSGLAKSGLCHKPSFYSTVHLSVCGWDWACLFCTILELDACFVRHEVSTLCYSKVEGFADTTRMLLVSYEWGLIVGLPTATCHTQKRRGLGDLVF